MRRCALPVLLLLLTGCQSVLGPFGRIKPDYGVVPKDDLRAVAHEIERAVQAGDREAVIAGREGIIVNTPVIMQAVRTRTARSALVNDFLDSGHGWERRDGFLWIIRSKAYKKECTRKSRDRDALVVYSEKDNRWAIYEGILKANGFSPKTLSTIRAIFYEARLACMRDGQKYEDTSGKMAYKRGGP